MLSIFLCDDDPFILRLAAETLSQLLTGQELEARMGGMAQTAAELYSLLERTEGERLVFLDLDFGEGKLNGIDIAREIHRIDAGIQIVFLTNHQEMAMKVLKGGAAPFGFMEKGTELRTLREGFRRYIAMAAGTKTAERGKEFVELAVSAQERLRVAREDILFVEAEKNISHGITFHTLNGSSVTVTGTLDEEEKCLGSGFLRVHRSYLVQKKHILGLKEGYLKLSSQQEVPCAFRKRGEIKKWLQG